MKKNNYRKCVFTNEILPKNLLVRFVKTKDNQILLDKNYNILGRGSYIVKDLEIINQALEKKVLNRSFKQKIEIDTYNQMKEEVNLWLKNK
ncbi:MAG: YlxR family protein [Metamycoplasmataceae bacterium]